MVMAREFFQLEAAAGIFMVLAAIAALIVANSGIYPYYHYFLNEVFWRIGFSDSQGWDFELKKPVLLWINDGLMAVFFFLVGLEIKRELLEGQLSSRDRALLPAFAAVGGMVVPALVFWLVNLESPETLSGWAIPAATDIAFALGILALIGSRVPVSLKVLLTAIAIIDDLGAIVVIAVFYSGGVKIALLGLAGIATAVLIVLNRRGVTLIAPYVLVGFVLWVAVLKSGIHPTLAGVIVALCVPLRDKKHPESSPLKHLEHILHPWVAFGILPVFAFANAGVPFTGMGLHSLLDPVTLGIILGLFVGKQLGIFSAIWLAVVLRLSPRPEGAGWGHLYGVALLCGIGFTMSLFIGALAYEGTELQASVRMGVLVGSILSAGAGWVVLRYLCKAPGQV
ncbi:MAG: Na+/H+ antiporter NhaA [Rhodospirillales bacterium]|nr:Na+/H+ antiporter NhaA [Rhodospirillales bacterium]